MWMTLAAGPQLVNAGRLRALGVGELGFLGILPEDLTGTMSADARVSGTREAPVIVASARLDSLRSAERERPSLALDVRLPFLDLIALQREAELAESALSLAREADPGANPVSDGYGLRNSA